MRSGDLVYDRPFDVQPMRGATLDDLDLLTFEKAYLPAAYAPDVLAAVGHPGAFR